MRAIPNMDNDEDLQKGNDQTHMKHHIKRLYGTSELTLSTYYALSQSQQNERCSVKLSTWNSVPLRHISSSWSPHGLFSSLISCYNLDNLQNHPIELPA